jgi:hypothetical protein
MNNNAAGSIATNAVAVVKSDTANNAHTYLYVGTGGTLSVVTEAGDQVQFTNVANGSWIWVRTSRVRSTGSTATDIIGFS